MQATNYASRLNRQAKAQTASYRVSVEIECTHGKFAGQRRIEESIFRTERGAKADLAYRTRVNDLPGESRVVSAKMEAIERRATNRMTYDQGTGRSGRVA